MKKLLALILAVLTMFSLVACGEKEEAPAPAPEQGAVEQPAVKYPTRSIELRTHSAGSTVDSNTRLFAQVLAKHLGENIIVVNDDLMYTAFQTMINSDPDGYVISGTTCNVQLNDVLGGTTYDSVEAAKFVSTYCMGGGYFVAISTEFANKHNVHSLDELVALTQAHPNEFTISTSYGAISELATYSLIENVGIAAYPVDLADSNTRLIAFIEGDLDIFVGNWNNVEQYVETGEVEVLCYYGDQRSLVAPDYPCTKELGYSVQPAQNYYYLSVPKDTPDEIVEILAAAAEKAVNDPEFYEPLRKTSATEIYLNPAETYDLLKGMKDTLTEVMGEA